MKKEIISFDCETAGPNPMKDRLLQFGYVIYSVDSKSIIESDKIIIKPEGEYNIDPQAEAIHNLSRDMIDTYMYHLEASQIRLNVYLRIA
jgi:DNA polymerase III epsilon subunit-like protein